MSDALAAARRIARDRKASRKDEDFMENLRKSRRKGRRSEFVTPSEVARLICRRTGAPRHIVWPIVEEMLEVVVEVLDNGKDLRLKGLGAFYWKRIPKRDGFKSNMTGKIYNLPERVRLTWAVPNRFKRARPAMEKYGVEMDTDKIKEASKDKKTESYVEDGAHCPRCGKDLDSGGACPEHGTEPLEKRRD